MTLEELGLIVTVYCILAAIIAALSTILHLWPVIYGLRRSGVVCFATANPKLFTIAYYCTSFMKAPAVFFYLFNVNDFNKALYKALKHQ